MSRFELPDYPYVESQKKGKRQKPTAIALYTSFTTHARGAAFGVAMNWHSNQEALPHHFAVDENVIIRSIPVKRRRDQEYYLLEGSKNVVSALLCYEPTYGVPASIQKQTAKLVAQLCVTYGIRPRYLWHEDRLRWLKRRSRRRGGIFLFVDGVWDESAFEDDVSFEINMLYQNR